MDPETAEALPENIPIAEELLARFLSKSKNRAAVLQQSTEEHGDDSI